MEICPNREIIARAYQMEVILKYLANGAWEMTHEFCFFDCPNNGDLELD